MAVPWLAVDTGCWLLPRWEGGRQQQPVSGRREAKSG